MERQPQPQPQPSIPWNARELRQDFRAVLFDIDGTLMRAARRGEYRELMCRMLVDIFGTEGDLRNVDFSGRTDQAIYREALERAGIGPDQIRARLPELGIRTVAIVTRMAEKGEVFRLCPGVELLLEALAGDNRFVTAVLTGNLEELALAKLGAAGIGRYFFLRGAYGSDAEDRNRLPAIAALRLSDQIGAPVTARRMVIVGDTPRDIECARLFGARVLAVATGFHDMEHLRQFEPDLVLPDLTDTPVVLDFLAG